MGIGLSGGLGAGLGKEEERWMAVNRMFMNWVDLTSWWAKCTPHHRSDDGLTMRFVCFPYLCNFTCGGLNLRSTCPLLTLSTGPL